MDEGRGKGEERELNFKTKDKSIQDFGERKLAENERERLVDEVIS